jgi:flagellar biosynthesis protein FliR
MYSIPITQLEAWLGQLFWPFMRIGACLMVVPAFGAIFVPKRVRLLLALTLAILVAPLIASVGNISAFSVTGLQITAQQILIGVALGFALQIIFDAVAMGGQLLANSMGLSFAFNVDPMRGSSTAALGQLYALLVMLTFLALNGHITIIEMLVSSFNTLPIAVSGLGAGQLWTLVAWGAQLFSGALAVALPGITALLIVNLAFGVMSRAAPTLNLFAVGFPVSLIFGLVIVLISLPALQSSFIELLYQTIDFIQHLLISGQSV